MNLADLALFRTSIHYKRGLLLYDEIVAEIKGRVACTREVCGILAEMVGKCAGNHLEIGALFGGTAILAAKMKTSGYVYVIDPLDGYYGKPIDMDSRLRPSPALLHQNAEHWDVDKAIHVTAAKSSPWPLASDAVFETALIDGDHTYAGCLADWINLKNRVNRYIMFDNYDSKHPEVVEVVRLACADPHWRPVLIEDIFALLERVA